MPALSDLFGLTRVINLPDRKDRLREITQQMDDMGMPFAPGNVELYVASRPADQGQFRSLGARGCFLSHLDILRDARDRNVESVLVFEDDCEILPRDRQRIVEAALELPGSSWGFLHLGHIEPLPDENTPRLIQFTGPLQTLHCYAVHRSVLAALIEYLEGCLVRPEGDPYGGPMDVDGALTMFRGHHPEIVTLVAQPSLARQRSSRSDITYHSFERLPGIKQAMGLARTLRSKLKSQRG